MRILHIDIETSPNLAYVWGLWKQNVAISQIEAPTEMLSFAAKWDGEDEVYFSSQFSDTKSDMVFLAWSLLDAADVVVHYNGRRFDIPHLNREFLEQGLQPPSTFKQVDVLDTAKSRFNFPSNKLDYVSQALGIGQKVSHKGFELWRGCMNNNPDDWATMEEYNRHDVILLEEVFNKLKPWIRSLPNLALYKDADPDKATCPSCGSENVNKKGFEYTSVSKFQRYVCSDCGKNSRGRKNLIGRDNLLIGVA